MTKQEKYIDIKKVIASKNKNLADWMPGFALKYIKRIAHEDDINETMRLHGHLQGLEFVNAVMDHLNTKVVVRGSENIPQSGGVILAANHPLGGLDGIAFMKAVGTVRSDMKFLVNDILLNIENFQPLFLPVNKHGNNPRQAMKLIDEAYASEEAVLVFPAGLVSRKLPGGIADLKWNKSFVNRALKYNRSIVPVHIEGRNSDFFYNLSRFRTKAGIKANIEMFYLADEMFRQRGKTITITFGQPVSPDTIRASGTPAEWAVKIREQVYSLANN